ncbi:SpaH/EbpB family LPXTG-anchored major pilin [Streptococcus constellatus]|uniref:Cna protein B-type domain protein n=1 Tax=Streptococcus constellatus subsp. constellatus SK53 TaxID=1095730 RepID=A0AAD2SUZ5_STRCV|nr:SpaH/EbpB family LPXTG-anchored major pilin [Streptococcus constellatus]EID19282.1 Cna protein B-type domain protein [Streptococcus constellatus subsp. constellatus SK53]MDP1485596.1 SpaH/EbpB family LPXTG-anchored major pilin [Streptococcus constellatus]QQT05230.1 SpaH/EbpB family LPXTG-anchored major pilin [Streptococcus constellatus]SUN39732.1 Cna protein B-type domain-containing protein [Streptococcus constellatus]BBD21776.1 Cna protein B-type domain protein [Streptococcus constellatus 
MKLIKKLFVAVAAIAMALLTTTAVSAAGTGSITITPPPGLDANASNTYTIYKVFDADGNGSAISYKLKSNHSTAPAGFSVDGQGNVSYTGTGQNGQLTQADIDAIKAYVTDADKVKEVTAKGSAPVTVGGLENGYYYVTTTTGTAVVINSTNPNARVEDKNTVPTVDKKITDANSYDADGKKALAEVGKTVKFESTITIGAGAKGYVYHDKMTAGLKYNSDVKAYVDGTEVPAANYEVTAENGDTFTVKFKDTYTATLEKGKKIVLKYSAVVTSDALSKNPAKNTASVSYGSNGSVNTTPESKTEVYNAKFTVTKHDDKSKPLAGAGFVIKNAAGKYYKYDAATKTVTWVADINQATEHKSNAKGEVEAFAGLANGTYTLVEKTVPAGYNKAADVTFTVAEHNYTAANLEQKATVVNKPGTELPRTGGLGTMLLTLVGSILVIGVGVLIVTKKRMSAK